MTLWLCIWTRHHKNNSDANSGVRKGRMNAKYSWTKTQAMKVMRNKRNIIIEATFLPRYYILYILYYVLYYHAPFVMGSLCRVNTMPNKTSKRSQNKSTQRIHNIYGNIFLFIKKVLRRLFKGIKWVVWVEGKSSLTTKNYICEKKSAENLRG